MSGNFIQGALTWVNNGLRQAILTWLGLSANPAPSAQNVYNGHSIQVQDVDSFQTMLTRREFLFPGGPRKW